MAIVATFVVIAILAVATEGKENWRADEGVLFADFALEEAFPGPVKQTEVAAMDDEPRRAGVGLDDVFGLGTGVFEACR